MLITRREFNIVKTLKRFLSKTEFKDFKELITKNVNRIEIEIDNEIRINYYNVNDYYNRKDLVYSMLIERSLGFKAKYSLNNIKKSYLNFIEKYLLNNDIALRLIKQLKNSDIIIFEFKEKRIRFEKEVTKIFEPFNSPYIDNIYFYLSIENKPKLRVMKLKGSGKIE
jgi:hypothetical protein